MDLSHLVLSQARTITALGDQVSSLKHQLAWFQRQVFGQKSERFMPEPDPTQMHLGEVFPVPSDSVPETRKAVPAHTRRVPKTDLGNTGDTVSFFDESRVPIETIIVLSTEMKGNDRSVVHPDRTTARRQPTRPHRTTSSKTPP